ncbi:MAG: thioredoxin [Epsilonproteobacteria bacterium]|nr:thioredoxin [Campylobacterota bacterium]
MKYKQVMVFLVLLLFAGCTSEEKSSVVLPSEGLAATAYEKIVPIIGKEAVLLEFGSTTCASCVEMGKILRKIKEEDPKSHVYFIEVYDDKMAMKNYGIQMIPTQIYLNAKGEEMDRHIGVVSYEQLRSKLKAEKIIQ